MKFFEILFIFVAVVVVDCTIEDGGDRAEALFASMVAGDKGPELDLNDPAVHNVSVTLDRKGLKEVYKWTDILWKIPLRTQENKKKLEEETNIRALQEKLPPFLRRHVVKLPGAHGANSNSPKNNAAASSPSSNVNSKTQVHLLRHKRGLVFPSGKDHIQKERDNFFKARQELLRPKAKSLSYYRDRIHDLTPTQKKKQSLNLEFYKDSPAKPGDNLWCALC